MTETAEDYELFHYGVKGMKWGVRRDRAVNAVKSSKVYKAGDKVYTKSGLRERDDSIRKAREGLRDDRKALREADLQTYAVRKSRRSDIKAAKRDARAQIKSIKKDYKPKIRDADKAYDESLATYEKNKARGEQLTTRMLVATKAIPTVTAIAGTVTLAAGVARTARMMKQMDLYKAAEVANTMGLPSPNTIIGEVINR